MIWMDHLPESCDACPCQYDLIACQAASIETFYEDSFTIFDESTSRHPNCPLKELVMCKDCKWYKTAYSWNGNECKVCAIEPYEPVRKCDDFCNFGERKNND